MFFKSILRGVLMIISITLLLISNSFADKYPSKPIKLIVPYGAGGGGDTTSRFIADLATDILGVKVLVENKTGGGGTIGIGAVAKSKPDGYTIGFISTSPITIRPHFMKMPYKPMDDLTYLGQFVSSPMPVILRSGSKWKSFEEMMSFAKSNPGKLRWSTAGQKGGPHMAMLAAFKKEGASTTYVPFKGGAKALAALLGKTIDMAVISDFAAPLAAGTIKIIAESTPDRNPSAPNVKTLAELGYPLSPAIFFGLAGPNGLSQDVINKWDDALGKIMKSSKFTGLLKKLKATPKYANSADFTKSVRADYTAAGKVLAGVKF